MPQPKEASAPPRPPDKKTAALLKKIDEAFFTFRFYPVAVKADAKKEAFEFLQQTYKTGDEPVRQLILYQFHEHLSKAQELKTMQNFEFFKRLNPNAEAAQLRIQVYRSMFNYHSSLEGLVELLHLLGNLGGDDAAKLLTHHLSFYSNIETEGMHLLRNAAIDALAHCPSPYAIRSLIRYVRYVDNEALLHRILDALGQVDKKLDTLKLPVWEKKKLREEIAHVLSQESKGTHYG